MPTDHPYRDAYALPEGLHFLNGATMSPQLRSVTEAGVAAVVEKEDPTRYVPARWLPPTVALRERFARLVGSPSADRVALVPSVSYALATVAQNAEVARGQKIVSVAEVFPSGYYTWRRLAAERGASVELVGVPAGAGDPGAAWNEALLGAVDETCALVAAPPIHWSSGVVYDLAALRERCDAVGALLVVDATQWAGARPLDVTALRPDALVAGGYKWLGGPYALGYLYLGERLLGGRPLEEAWMNRAGSEDFSRLTEWTDEYRPGAQRYNVGEMSNFVHVAMASAALAQLLEWGVDGIARRTDALVGPYWEAFRAAGFAVGAPPYRSAHLFGLALPPSTDRAALKAALDAERVAVSFRGRYLRVSPHASSRAADLDALLRVLARHAAPGRPTYATA